MIVDDLELPQKLFKTFNKRSYAVGDIEAILDSDKQFTFKLGVIMYNNKLYTYYSVKDMFNGVVELGIKKIYFHNLDFDFLFFVKEMDLGNGRIIMSGNMMLEVVFDKFSFVNSLSILPMSLKKVVVSLLDCEWKSWTNQKDDIFGLSDGELEIYCGRDCYLLFSSLYLFFDVILKEFGIRNFLTLPSLALNIYKKHYVSEDLFSSSMKKNFFEKDYYFGGHTEKFINDVYYFKNVNYYDVNSLYPSVMRDLKFGISEPIFISPSVENLYDLDSRDVCFYSEISIDVDCEALRFFVKREGSGNYYKFGICRYKISEVSFRFLVENGYVCKILEVHSLLYYDDSKYIFRKYVDDLFVYRKKNNAFNTIFKLLLNSLYGKFGQKEDIVNIEINPVDVCLDSCDKFVQYNNNVVVFNDDFLVGKQLLTLRKDLAGKITEGARVLMHRFRHVCVEEGFEPIYQDTDSVMVRGSLEDNDRLRKYLCNKTLGLFKRENDKPLYGYIVGQKIYALKNEFGESFGASKGVKNFSYDDCRRLSYHVGFRKYVFSDEVCSCYSVLDNNSPKNDFYNTRFTKFKTLMNGGFFGIQVVPHYINNVRERLD